MSGRFANYSLPMPTDPDDWRRHGHEQDLPPGTVFVRRDYRALDEHWEHDHCEMCWAKFTDPQFSASHAQFIGEHPDVLTEDLVTKVEERRLERYVDSGARCEAQGGVAPRWGTHHAGVRPA